MRLFDHPAGALRLDRYPPGAANDALQAWDAAAGVPVAAGDNRADADFQ